MRDRRLELLELMNDVPAPPTEEELAAIRAIIQDVIDDGTPATRNALIEALCMTYG